MPGPVLQPWRRASLTAPTTSARAGSGVSVSGRMSSRMRRRSIESPVEWPWREGNQFQLLEASDQYFDRMIEAIEAAQSYILCELYLVQSGVLAGRFIEAFVGAA